MTSDRLFSKISPGSSTISNFSCRHKLDFLNWGCMGLLKIVETFKNMKDKILDFVNYIKNISKQKVTSEKIFMYMKKNDESVSEEEI